MAGAVTANVIEHRPDRVVARLERPEGVAEVTLDIRGASFTEERDFLVPAMLLPAMRAAAGLVIRDPISPRLLEGATKVQEIMVLWDEDYARVKIEAPKREPSRPASGTAAFFSAGVDSFYTTLKYMDEITHLIFVNDLFDPRASAEEAAETARAAASELGKPLIEIDTNLTQFRKATAVIHPWYHGSALAALALLMQGTVGRVLIASTYSYDLLRNWGTHPLIDPLWSTESLEIAHDGCEATRPMKVSRIAESDIAMRHLRVCQNRPLPGLVPSDGLNCGCCKKCLMTMTNLRAIGALERCETLPHELDLDVVAQLSIDDKRDLLRLEENLNVAERNDPELAAALRKSLERNRSEDPMVARMERKRAEELLKRQARKLEELEQSWSWRITAPLRAIGGRRNG